MRKKYCTRLDKTVYAKICIECGKLAQTEQPIRKIGPVFTRNENGVGTLMLVAEYETEGWECEHLFEKVVFKGPHTDKWRKRLGQTPEPAVGTMLKYQYEKGEITSYYEN